MADLKRWFKVWTSVLEDPDFTNLALEDRGRWIGLGALTALVGDQGVLTISAPARRLCQVLEVTDLDEAIMTLRRLPNIMIEEGQIRHGTSAVTLLIRWKNWVKYQEDSTQAQRQQKVRFRHGARGEERRREEKRTPPTPPSLFSPPESRTDADPAPPRAEPGPGPDAAAIQAQIDQLKEKLALPAEWEKKPAARMNVNTRDPAAAIGAS